MSSIYKNAEAYSQNNSLQYQFAMKALTNVEIHSNDTILDLGCGDGLITSNIALKNPTATIIGTDISEPMIEFASKKYAAIKNLKFTSMDARKNTFQNKFNLIISFNTLHWIKDQDAVIQGLINSLAVNGKILLLFSHKKSVYHFALDKTCLTPRWKHYFKNYISPRIFIDKNTYANKLIDAGFEIKNITEEEMTHYFDSTEKLKGFYRGSLANLNILPDDLKEAFLDDLTEEYLTQLHITPDEKIPVSFWCVQIQAITTKEHKKRD